MGNAFSFFRLPVALLERPAFLLPELNEAVDSEPEWKPAQGENSGRYLERLLVDQCEDATGSEYLRALGAQMTFHADSVGDFFTRLDAILQAYGDLDLLGFQCQVPSRADVLAHLERLPERARRFGRANTVACLAPSEVRALAAALRAAKQDGFGKIAPRLRGEEVGLLEALGSPEPEAGDIDLWLVSGADAGERNLDDLPESRGAPAIPRRRSFLDRLFGRA
ncbi:hypothetical protein [Corallococcus carmarthensis]|uniref:hypothetical protein n=1 Tax=Corallococcus carmarthensis TaxID=2316728 RepID=UPI00148E4972|nr:hypothetical protein [Corallococcus carmarthensis]NOK22156.1 hypothetical protein [Corallococcus carmarthensis]